MPLGGSAVSNRAQPQRLLGRDRPFRLTPAALCRAGISSLRRTGSVWVWRLNGRVLGLAAAGMRSGARSWELSGLYLREDRSGDPRELLERVSQTAASLGAERVFLRLRSGDPLIHTARAAGYYPRIGEVLYRHAGPASVTQAPVASYVDRKRIRLADRADRMDLFRLYCASTPSEVRQAAGMSLDQWRASRERWRGRRTELVLVGDGGLEAWLLAVKRGRVGMMEAMACPGDGAAVAQLAGLGVEALGDAASRFFLVADHQEHVAAELERMRFQPHAEYVTLVRSLAIPVKDKAPVRVMAASS